MNRKFTIGDFVENDKGDIGVVEWIENKCMGISIGEGYIGINLLSGSRGFQAPVRENTCKKSSLKKLCKKLYSEKKEVEEILAKCKVNINTINKLKEENNALKRLLSIYMD